MAGPAPSQDEPEPESDTRVKLMGVPAEADVCNFCHRFYKFADA